MSTTAATTTGLIPTTASSLYDTFGLDVVTPATYDDDGYVVVDMEPVKWIEIGAFDPDRPELTDPHMGGEARRLLDAAASAAGYRIDWDTYRETATSEYHEVDLWQLA